MTVLVLHNIRSAHNVGSMFRTASAAGVSRVILSGYTPGAVDPRGKQRKEFVKVSLGAENYVPSERAARLTSALKKLKQAGYTVVAVEQHACAKNIFTYKPGSKKLAVVMGNEVRGLSKQALMLCDAVVEIPMHGLMVRQAHHPRHVGRGKESLNVSVAAGVALFALLK